MTDKNDKRYDYVVYKLCCDECDDYYVGSTRNMVQRKKNHKSKCHNANYKTYNTKIYRTMREFGGWENWRMVPLELMGNTTKFEAECQEEVVRMRLKAELNSKKASCGGITTQEYMKDYNEENKDHLKEYKKNYYEEHKDYYKEYYKEYNEEHKEQLREQKKKNFDCVCGARITNGGKSQHFKTQKHQNYVDSLENET
tara:strand:+ start:10 stop:603 length:594 start_codon:yes stop_codon:yes gene_type:complete